MIRSAWRGDARSAGLLADAGLTRFRGKAEEHDKILSAAGGLLNTKVRFYK